MPTVKQMHTNLQSLINKLTQDVNSYLEQEKAGIFSAIGRDDNSTGSAYAWWPKFIQMLCDLTYPNMINHFFRGGVGELFSSSGFLERLYRVCVEGASVCTLKISGLNEMQEELFTMFENEREKQLEHDVQMLQEQQEHQQQHQAQLQRRTGLLYDESVVDERREKTEKSDSGCGRVGSSSWCTALRWKENDNVKEEPEEE
ncbi:unnamed protein product [Didymodactylos carnosus]|uniref:Uncharacterized protein n=1 Tax=Didymodactylos carnosus TaxID=1234261 RepID=A0A814KWG9_9BILA|nr:unnamed protein product [Didymodactylos carnosus]CAF1078133.1 unnamed protein product [Didymodactylos carnosus]CAF3824458.1 unnamed protein product [Didymodactylos carnosus]CAF3841605.1 unnamed protein product [Didymodactylos carnosus]